MIAVKKVPQYVISMDEATARALKTLLNTQIHLTNTANPIPGVPTEHQEVVKQAVDGLFKALDDTGVYGYVAELKPTDSVLDRR